MKRALITGMCGQDGSYLAEELIDMGYEVHGFDTKYPDGQPDEYFTVGAINHPTSLQDMAGLTKLIKQLQPDECYHLAGVSFVSYDSSKEVETMATNITGTHNMLMLLQELCPKCKFFFAGSSEMFGNVNSYNVPANTFLQNESTPFNPRSIYGVSKTVGFNLTKYYREHHGMFACSGIMYNHESSRRSIQYVSRKITRTVARISLGLTDKLEIGNLSAVRDWGHARDYVSGMHAILNAKQPDDFILSTGLMHSVGDIVETAFASVNLDSTDYLEIKPFLFRPETAIPLVGDWSKAGSVLGWSPFISFEDMIVDMVQADIEDLKKGTEDE